MKAKTKKKRPYRNSFKFFIYAVKFGKGLFIWRIVFTVVKTTKTMLVDVYLLKFVLDAIMKEKTFRETVGFVLLCAFVCFAEMYIDDWINQYVYPISKNKIHKAIHQVIFKKVCTADLSCFDNTEFYDKYIWTLENSSQQIMSCFDNYMKMFTSVTTVLAMLAFLMTINPIVIVFSFIPIIFVYFCGKKVNKLDFKCDTVINSISRKKNYSRRVFYLKQYAQDIRCTKIKDVMMDSFLKSADEEITTQKKYAVSKLLFTFLKDGSYGLVQMLGLYLFLIYMAIVKKVFSAGTCAAIINAVDRLTGYFYQLFSLLLSIQKNGIYASSIFDFLNSRSEIETIETDGEKTTEFECLKINNLNFKYDNSNDYLLESINFNIRRGEKIAIVGLNGAGKSTLIKLMLRLYDPQSGEILYNGKNIKQFNVNDYRKRFSTIFQDFQIYAASLASNITMDLVNDDESKIIKCLKEVKLNFDFLDLERCLTREFCENGLELSGGQNQKIAIARALYANRDFVIMDEASSAIDPITENEINELLINSMKEKTAVIVTHRLTTIKYVDKIIFMENGRIVERGTHKSLMELNGKYAKMYRLQSEQYFIES